MSIVKNPVFAIERDTELRYTTPANDELSDAGIRELIRYVQQNRDKVGFCYFPEDWDWRWLVTKTEDSSYNIAGTMPKRIAKYAYQHPAKHKIPKEIIRQIGDIVKPHVEDGRKFIYDVTPSLTWHSGDYGDDGSCLWGENDGALECMMDHDFWAIRFYNPEDPKWGQGRCFIGRWNHPCEADGKTHEIAVLFNAYGKTYSLVTIARLLATITGQTYRKIDCHNYGASGGLIWINNAKAYAIAPLHVLNEITAIDFQIQTDGYQRGASCDNCGEHVAEDYYFWAPNGSIYCEYCWGEHCTRCNKCGEDIWSQDAYSVDGDAWCQDCAADHSYVCGNCSERSSNIDNFITINEDFLVCEWCFTHSGNYNQCEECGNCVSVWHYIKEDDTDYCDTCYHTRKEELDDEEKERQRELEEQLKLEQES